MSESHLQQMSREELVSVVRDLFTLSEEQRAVIEEHRAIIEEQRGRIEHLEAEVASLRGGSPPSQTLREPPSFVKPNRQQELPRKPRKKRPHGFARRRSEPMRVVEHAPQSCSGCGQKLSGGWVYARREVLEIPVTPVEVVEHRFLARRCGICGHRERARAELSEVVLGKSRLGVRLMSWIAYLDTVCRVPLSIVQRVLEEVYRLHLSQGALVRVLHAVAQAGRATYDGLLEEVRRSAVVHVDETGAREEGQNGYLWSLSTPQVRYYHRDQSRAARVVQELLGHDPTVYQARTRNGVMQAQQVAHQTAAAEGRGVFQGKLVSDFYSAYSWYRQSGWYSQLRGAEHPTVEHQRCLVHLDRDLDELKAGHPNEEPVCEWVEKVLCWQDWTGWLSKGRVAGADTRAR